jgi:glyoxylase-like metal-dependent hydrolase (beta-lactamase superfamily II)
MKIIEGVYVIKPGKLVKDGDIIIYMSSSVVLMDDEFPLLVDTGLKEDWERIKMGIEEVGFSIGEIKMIINTHLHIDHVGCNDMFDVNKYAHPIEIERIKKSGYLPYNTRVSRNIRIIETPGHCYGDISVVFEGETVVVAAGDAIPTKNNYIKRVPPRMHVDREMAMESFGKIERIANIIIPGHDGPIRIK